MKVPRFPDSLDLKGGPFRELRYKSADLFLHDLSPLGRLFGPEGPLGPHWLFRGLAKCGYTLVPSALRRDDKSAARLFLTDPKLWSHLVWTDRKPLDEERLSNEKKQYEAERRVLCAFFYAADKYGLPLPEDSQRLRTDLEKDVTPCWPPDELLSLMALAQHYGCPTRLLDWSSDSMTAAWFAASGALGFTERGRRPDPPQQDGTANDPQSGTAEKDRMLVVWALSDWELEFEKKLKIEMDNKNIDPRYRIRIVTAPRSGNENLHAQHGVFTLTRDKDLKEDTAKRPLDALLQERHEMHPTGRGHPTILRMTLPQAEARRLLTLLNRVGVCSAALFPGYAGIADALWESRLLMRDGEFESDRPVDTDGPEVLEKGVSACGYDECSGCTNPGPFANRTA